MKKGFLLCAAVLCCACGAATKRDAQPAFVAERRDRARAVEAPVEEPIARSDASSEVAAAVDLPSFNGTLFVPPQSRATVTLTMDGTVRTLALEPGARVRRGEVLCTLENPSFIALQQTFLDAHAQAEFLRTEYLRQEVLVREEAASQKRVQQSRADYRSMKSRMDAAAAQLRLLDVDTAQLLREGIRPFLQVKAPIGGYVARMDMNLGRHFAAGEPLCEIIDKSRLALRLTAYERDLDRVGVGDGIEFRVNGLGDRRFCGTVTRIGQQVDEAGRSIEVYARVEEQDPRFRPGMYVTAQVCAAGARIGAGPLGPDADSATGGAAPRPDTL